MIKRKIKSLEDYIPIIRKLYNIEGCGGVEKIYYRGQSNNEFKLIPSLSRRIKGHTVDSENYIGYEKQIINRCKLEYPEVFKGNNKIDTIALLRHYGMPTRLLDVTENPLIALFFACKDDKNKDGEVFAFNTGENAKTCTSYDDNSLFRGKHVVFVRTKVFSERQRQQQGLFIWFPAKCLKGIDKSSSLVSEIIKIPSECKGDILEELKMVGISEKTLFPDNLDICCQELLDDIVKDAYSC